MEQTRDALQGIFPALLTPFNAHGTVHTAALRRLIQMNLRKGVQGFYATGSTGEAFLLEDHERKLIVEVCAEETRGKAALIVHVGAIATAKAIEFARHAQSCGATAISSIPPFYYKFSKSAIMRYYQEILDATELPMIVYTMPALSGVEFTLHDYEAFAANPRIIGIKYTSQNLFVFEEIQRNFPSLMILNGYDELFLPALSIGAKGAIGSTFNVMAEIYLQIAAAYRAKDIETARQGQSKANHIIRTLIETDLYPGLKYILTRMGIEAGECRKPFEPLKDEHRPTLDVLLKDEFGIDA